MVEAGPLYEQAVLVARRLERVSVDSIWARRSGGRRGALLRWIDAYQQAGRPAEIDPREAEQVSSLIMAGFTLLERAAREQAGY